VRVRSPLPGYSGEYQLPLWGRHQALNAVLAAAVSADQGIEREDIEWGLADCRPSLMRMQIHRYQGICILDDSYNANLDSMRAALSTLREIPGGARRIAVLGDMAELGCQSENEHAALGRLAAEAGVDHLVAVGAMAECQAQAAREAGLGLVSVHRRVDQAAHQVRDMVRSGDVILIKGSRSSGLEKVCQALRAGRVAEV